MLEEESASLRYHVCQFSDKTDNFDFLSPNLPKNGFCGWHFKNLSLDSESAPATYLESQVLVKMGNFEFFSLNLGKLCVIFWLEYCWGCCRELGAGWNELSRGGWSWVEVEKSWVEVGAWFSYAFVKVVLHARLNLYWESSGCSRFVIQSLLVLYK